MKLPVVAMESAAEDWQIPSVRFFIGKDLVGG
jgi:hypothetical protein